MNKAEAVKLLSTVNEEDLFEHGVMFGNMDAGGAIFWRVLEAINTPEGRRVTFHLYYRDIFLKALIGTVSPEGNVQWGMRA
jgi:hypothetical protein